MNKLSVKVSAPRMSGSFVGSVGLPLIVLAARQLGSDSGEYFSSLLDALRHPDITFWTAWEGDELMGCGALKQLSPEHAELKSMRTTRTHLRKGVARAMLRHILAAAQAKGFQRISLETGTPAPFVAAQKLYASEGFVECGPFASYVLDPYSVFMSKML